MAPKIPFDPKKVPVPGDMAPAGPAIPPAPRAVNPPVEKTPDTAKVVAEVKDLLTQAMDKLSGIGVAPEGPKPMIPPARPPLGFKGGGY